MTDVLCPRCKKSKMERRYKNVIQNGEEKGITLEKEPPGLPILFCPYCSQEKIILE